MYFYICSDFPVAIKVNGNYVDSVNGNNLLLPVCQLDNSLIEACSLCSCQTGLNFILNKNFLLCPPDNVNVTDLDGGYLIKLSRTYLSSGFKIFAQEKTQRWACTVYAENGYKLTVETPNDFYIESLAFDVKNAKVHSCCNGRLVVVECFGEENVVCAYAVTDKIKRVLCLQANLENTDGNLTTRQDFCDIARHNAYCTWRFDGEKIVCIDKKVTCKQGFNINTLPQEVLPFAFLEELLVGGNIEPYLTGNVLENKNKLTHYLGQFLGVMPPPAFKDSRLVGIIRKTGERLYSVEYLTFEYSDGKICNLSFV